MSDTMQRLMDETRSSRQRLLDHIAGHQPYARPLVRYKPLDSAGTVSIEQDFVFDEGLFAHDIHVTAYVCNVALKRASTEGTDR